MLSIPKDQMVLKHYQLSMLVRSKCSNEIEADISGLEINEFSYLIQWFLEVHNEACYIDQPTFSVYLDRRSNRQLTKTFHTCHFAVVYMAGLTLS